MQGDYIARKIEYREHTLSNAFLTRWFVCIVSETLTMWTYKQTQMPNKARPRQEWSPQSPIDVL